MNGPGTLPPGMTMDMVSPPPRPRYPVSGWQAEQDARREQAEREEREAGMVTRGDVVRVIR